MKLKDMLTQLKYRIIPNQEAIHDDILKQVYSDNERRTKNLMRMIGGGIAALLLLTGIVIYSINYYKFDSSTNINGDIAALSPVVYVAADSVQNNTVATNTTLNIVTKQSMSAKKLSECISVTPEVPFSIKKKGTNRFTLVFDKALDSNTSYTVCSNAEDKTLYRWSLQTESSFKITNAYPADSEVDVNTAIEITFSESNVNAFSDYFTISPHVDGTFKHNGRTWLFLPNAPLDPYTVYTVTVSKDIMGANDALLGKDYTFSFTTGASEDKWAYVANNTFDIADTFAASASPYATVYAQGMGSPTADVTVYKLPDSEKYLQLHSKYNKNSIISSAIAQDIVDNGLEVHSKFSVSAIPDPENDQLFYFNYPKELESGYYVTEINWNNVRLYQLLQVSDLSVYAAANEGTYIVWVNSIQTGLPISNAVVEINGRSAKTNKNGIATITPELQDETDPFITVNSETLLPHIIHAQNSTDQTSGAKSDYYSYLYTNSSIYHTTDTVKIWGAVLKRNQSAKSPTATVYAGWNNTEYPVELDSTGTFTIEIPIEKYKMNQSGELTLRVNGYDHNYKYVTVVDYELPTYSLSMHTNKNAYFADETIEYTIHASYYDGTPAGNLTLTDNNETVLTTDQNGTSIYNKAAPIDPELYQYSLNSCDPQAHWQYIETDAIEGDSAFTESPVLVFANNEYLQADITQDGTRYTLEIKTNSIETDKINALSPAEFFNNYYDLDTKYFLGQGVDKEITLEVHAITYERNKIGSYYDPIQKKLQLQYEYIQKDDVIKSDTFSTKDGIATLKDYAIPKSEGSRYIKLSMKDASGKDCFVTVYIDHMASDGLEQLEFANLPLNARNDQKLEFGIYDPTVKQHVEGSFIYLALGDDCFISGISEDGIAKFTFDEKCVPDITVFGAYFDGTSLHAVTPQHVYADLSDREIFVDLSTDKEHYMPGETVSLDITTTDRSGKPISAMINVNVMDRALLSIANNDSNILDELYISRAPVDIYTSLPIQYYGEGGGGGEPTRSDFEDTPAFLNEKTDKNGKATVTFTLPDSLTSWVISARAVTENVCAGNNQTEITTGKALFAAVQYADTVKTTDDAVIAFRCDGSAINSQSKLQTSVSVLSDDQIISTQTFTPIASTLQYANFGKLKEDSYVIKVEVSDGSNSDSAEYPLNVLASNLTLNTVTDLTNVSEGVSDLILTDGKYARYAEFIDILLQGSSSRLEHTVGEKYAAALTEQFNVKAYKQVDWHFLNAYCIGGGYTAYTANSESDLFLTARLASLFPDEIDQEFISWYFDEILSDENATIDEVICALWGKAALHEAVEKDLAYYYADGNVFSTEQQLYFALAYAYGGNQSKANEIYEKHIAPKLIRQIDSAYLKDEDAAVAERCNSMLALLTSRLSSQDADSVFNYLLTNDAQAEPISLELVAYLMEYTPLLEGKNQVRITFNDGSSKEITYNRFAPAAVRIEAHQVNGIQITSLRGETVAKANATISGDVVSKIGKKLDTIPCYIDDQANLGDFVSLNLSIDPAKISGHKLDVVLPAGIRYVKSYTASDENTAVLTTADPDVLTVYISGTVPVDITLQCKAALPGNFVIEPIISIVDSSLSHYATDACSITVIDPSQAPPEGENPTDGEESQNGEEGQNGEVLDGTDVEDGDNTTTVPKEESTEPSKDAPETPEL